MLQGMHIGNGNTQILDFNLVWQAKLSQIRMNGDSRTTNPTGNNLDYDGVSTTVYTVDTM